MSDDYEPLPDDELAALGDADLAVEEDPLARLILTALTRAHSSGLVFGGNPTTTIDPSGWTKGTLPAVAVYIAAQVRTSPPPPITRGAARRLHGRIFGFMSRATSLPPGMMEAEIDLLIAAVADASSPTP